MRSSGAIRNITADFRRCVQAPPFPHLRLTNPVPAESPVVGALVPAFTAIFRIDRHIDARDLPPVGTYHMVGRAANASAVITVRQRVDTFISACSAILRIDFQYGTAFTRAVSLIRLTQALAIKAPAVVTVG